MNGGAEGGADRLLQFARGFIGSISHYNELRTEVLAEGFREEFGLTPFPLYGDLLRTCTALGIPVSSLPGAAPMHGVNAWLDGRAPLIKIREDIARGRSETTLCHELREVIENAFKRVKPAYVGLDTHDNRVMNPESDQFAGYLLMQSEAARACLSLNGFDFSYFAGAVERSLPSVVTRAQTLFPASWPGAAPVMGLWLYEAPWRLVEAGATTVGDLHVTQISRLKGFSTNKSRRSSELAAMTFPAKHSPASEASVVAEAVRERHRAVRILRGLNLFDDYNFVLVAEPSFVHGAPWRVLLSAVRMDGLDFVSAWFRRLGVGDAEVSFQQV